MGWTRWALRINAEVLAILLACRDPRTPRHAKIFALLVVAYALSPIDLIPDFIPGAGYLDDLILVPIGIVIARRLIPAHVLTESRRRADATVFRTKPLQRAVVVMVIVFWLLLLVVSICLVLRAF